MGGHVAQFFSSGVFVVVDLVNERGVRVRRGGGGVPCFFPLGGLGGRRTWHRGKQSGHGSPLMGFNVNVVGWLFRWSCAARTYFDEGCQEWCFGFL